ncbi:MAG TPA: hypothetical protein VIS99_07235 [Terrimicrobiaceae bacterium]
MKVTSIAIASVALLGSYLVAQEDTKKYEAEILRSASGHVLDDNGFSQGTVPLRKGMILQVLEHSFSDVILDFDGQRIKVQKSDARLFEAKATDEESAGGTGVLRIVSAKYGRAGDRKYDVKQEIRKRLSEGSITGPVEILVSDALLGSRAGFLVQTGVLQGNRVILQRDTPCILTITYEYNGARFTKEVREGHDLVLP